MQCTLTREFFSINLFVPGRTYLRAQCDGLKTKSGKFGNVKLDIIIITNNNALRGVILSDRTATCFLSI